MMHVLSYIGSAILWGYGIWLAFIALFYVCHLVVTGWMLLENRWATATQTAFLALGSGMLVIVWFV